MEKDFGEKEQHSEQHLYTWAWHELLVIDLAASEHASYANPPQNYHKIVFACVIYAMGL